MFPLLLLLALFTNSASDARENESLPNIIVILADDLGYGELGCYGQQKIRTPNLDRLASQGMRFNHFYSGSPVCAPSRCTLLTGLHTGHAYIRGNKEVGGWGPEEPEGQWPIPLNTITLASLLQGQGYATAALGKWGLGGPGTTGAPENQGFDLFYGYLCQRVAHNYYPTHLWRNGEKEFLPGNDWFSAHQRLESPPSNPSAYAQYQTNTYAPDLILDEALSFMQANRDQPFFLYYATPVPHVALQVPADSVDVYASEGWDHEPYLGQKSYLPHPTPRAAYAAMITRLDRDLGLLFAKLDELGLADNTIVIFTSDNGPTYAGGVDYEFFDSNGPLRGLKGSLYEGGIRVPFIVRWPGKIEANSQSDQPAAFWDLMPTLCDIAGIEITSTVDGISLVPTFSGEVMDDQAHPRSLYWEFRGNQAVRQGRWKAYLGKDSDSIELYDLKTNDFEGEDVASKHPEVVRELEQIMHDSHKDSEHFPLK